MTGKSFLLDTNIVVKHFREGKVFKEPFIKCDLYLPQVALAELYAGACKSARPEYHKRMIEAFLPSVIVLSSDHQTTQLYGEVWAFLSRKGKMIPQNDIWIVALAFQYEWPLVSNDGHFENIENLEVLHW